MADEINTMPTAPQYHTKITTTLQNNQSQESKGLLNRTPKTKDTKRRPQRLVGEVEMCNGLTPNPQILVEYQKGHLGGGGPPE